MKPGANDDASTRPTLEDDPISKLTAELEKVRADSQKHRDQLLRTAADFDNFRKRSRKDVEEAQRKGLERALTELLPVSDNLDRALQASATVAEIAPILEGIRMVHKFFEDALSRLGVERVQAVGVPFDPSVHEAVQQVETEEAPPGTIVAEMLPGYRLGQKLLRAAMVSVARAPAAAAEAGSGAEGEGSSSEPGSREGTLN
jgi:molecular chaperone GrpE